MSEDNQADVSSSYYCASCGTAEIDDIKLKNCTGCDLVRYCSDACQADHKSQHEEDCKKRAAALRDEILFKQPESTHLGDCPICMLPMPFDSVKAGIGHCCSKMICGGCAYAFAKRVVDGSMIPLCPFCREPTGDETDIVKRRMKRVEANDPAAMFEEGVVQGNKANYTSAFEYFTRAAELGDAGAHYNLSLLYHSGRVIEKDGGEGIHHLEEAAIGGHPKARYLLGRNELTNNKNTERAVKHWIIAAAQGYDESIQVLMDAFKKGFVEKDVLAAALRAHQAAVDATKSPQRKKVEEFLLAKVLGNM